MKHAFDEICMATSLFMVGDATSVAYRNIRDSKDGVLYRAKHHCEYLWIFFNRDSPDGSRTGLNARFFSAFPLDRSEVRAATINSGSPNGGRGADLTIFAGIWTHFSHR